jgi:AcrR family transcriptional regulator
LEADVPVGLVSYHFEGKPSLYRAVFEALKPTIQQRKAGLALAQLEDDPKRRLEMIVKAILVPMLNLRSLEGSLDIGRLLAHEAGDPRSFQRGILQDLFDPVALKAIELLKEIMPDRSTAEIVWAFQMIIGTMIFIMADAGRAKMLSGGACDPTDVDATLRYVVPLLLNGISGPVSRP